jgi:DNA invertase Pin-like site-specific DNA recombinase
MPEDLRDTADSRPAKHPRAYSYLRFSTPEQQRGDSFRRQSESAQRYADQHDLDLDQDLTFQDLGVSAFRGRNVVEGSLGAFLKAVDEGRVSRGSYLLVESLDRLSRDRLMAALALFQSLLERGITVVTLADSKVFTTDSLNDLPDLMWFLMIASRAHEESVTKSHRGKAFWKAKRLKAAEDGTPLTSIVPAWLRLDPKTGDLEVIEATDGITPTSRRSWSTRPSSGAFSPCVRSSRRRAAARVPSGAYRTATPLKTTFQRSLMK